MTEYTKCGDNDFEIIAKAKADILDKTNIDSSPEEMAVLDNILFRCWQMGWLKKYEEPQLQANLDEAAEEYEAQIYFETVEELENIKAAFKAGAKWMAEKMKGGSK